ncbi:MAG: hypothetical protein MMC23_006957 [Stictis urceolatum]|nr:hypothetical protein [Stictis urceolata]
MANHAILSPSKPSTFQSNIFRHFPYCAGPPATVPFNRSQETLSSSTGRNGLDSATTLQSSQATTSGNAARTESTSRPEFKWPHGTKDVRARLEAHKHAAIPKNCEDRGTHSLSAFTNETPICSSKKTATFRIVEESSSIPSGPELIPIDINRAPASRISPIPSSESSQALPSPTPRITAAKYLSKDHQLQYGQPDLFAAEDNMEMVNIPHDGKTTCQSESGISEARQPHSQRHKDIGHATVVNSQTDSSPPSQRITSSSQTVCCEGLPNTRYARANKRRRSPTVSADTDGVLDFEVSKIEEKENAEIGDGVYEMKDIIDSRTTDGTTEYFTQWTPFWVPKHCLSKPLG